ncbi:MAG: hypothetical protein U0793_34255 [Gemmataceae bacterium]
MAKPLSVDWRKDTVPQDLVELRNHIDHMPLQERGKLLPLCDRIAHFTRLQARLVKIAQDAVDQLQLDVKYLIFDCEATRRERDELRELIEEIDEEGEQR